MQAALAELRAGHEKLSADVKSARDLISKEDAQPLPQPKHRTISNISTTSTKATADASILSTMSAEDKKMAAALKRDRMIRFANYKKWMRENSSIPLATNSNTKTTADSDTRGSAGSYGSRESGHPERPHRAKDGIVTPDRRKILPPHVPVTQTEVEVDL